MGKEAGTTIFAGNADEFLPPYTPEKEFDISFEQFDVRYDEAVSRGPRFGRFYPKGLLRGIPGVFRGNPEPFRCVGLAEKEIMVDFNHPLSHYSAQLSAVIESVGSKQGDVGGQCTDWGEVLLQGPGMQARRRGFATDFFSDSPFRRDDESDDAVFYRVPRLVTHIDDEAVGVIRAIYGSHVRSGMRVLDLMSSFRSHIPEDVRLQALEGLGLNGEEMEKNPQLTGFVIHDLNRDHRLPFRDRSFDAVICTVSVEYLVKPFEVFAEVARVLEPGGIFIVTFSNRWFPPKTIRVWRELHEFERMGLVLEYFQQTGQFQDLHTYSSRGRPRPFHDKYFLETQQSDPVYAVWGRTPKEVATS